MRSSESRITDGLPVLNPFRTVSAFSEAVVVRYGNRAERRALITGAQAAAKIFVSTMLERSAPYDPLRLQRLQQAQTAIGTTCYKILELDVPGWVVANNPNLVLGVLAEDARICRLQPNISELDEQQIGHVVLGDAKAEDYYKLPSATNQSTDAFRAWQHALVTRSIAANPT